MNDDYGISINVKAGQQLLSMSPVKLPKKGDRRVNPANITVHPRQSMELSVDDFVSENLSELDSSS